MFMIQLVPVKMTDCSHSIVLLNCLTLLPSWAKHGSQVYSTGVALVHWLHVGWLLFVPCLHSCQSTLWAASGEQCHLLLQWLLVPSAQAQLPVPLESKARHLVELEACPAGTAC